MSLIWESDELTNRMNKVKINEHKSTSIYKNRKEEQLRIKYNLPRPYPILCPRIQCSSSDTTFVKESNPTEELWRCEYCRKEFIRCTKTRGA